MEAAALTSPGTRRAVPGIAALVLAADQVSKSLVVSAAPGGTGGGPVSVRLVRNTGASFGIGASHPVVITVVAAAGLSIAAVLLSRTRSRPVALFLAAVIGGAAGNLADRLLRSPGLPSAPCRLAASTRWCWRLARNRPERLLDAVLQSGLG